MNIKALFPGIVCLGVVLSCIPSAPVFAQLAPAPHAAPRTPVNREALAERHAAAMRDVTGQALILDGDKLRIDDTELRLFGIVPPQLSANFGPQARAALDALVGGQMLTCHLRDRDHDGRLLATCQTPNGSDPALDLLRRGLAVAARGSLTDTDLVEPYIAAEQAAENAKLGLWSVTLASAPEAPKAEVKADLKAETPKVPEPVQPKPAEVQAKPPVVVVPVKPVTAYAPKDEAPAVADIGFVARYQFLIAGLLMLATALSVIGALVIHRRSEKRDEMKALAAGLRGELLAARAVCQTRIKSIMTEDDDRVTSWPRIRSTLYQAYVGRLGWLGAELARQIASIYGQASDYASYYNSLGDNDAAAAMPKRQALQSLAAHIDEVLPRLAGIEQTGERMAPNVYPVSTLQTMPPIPEPQRAPTSLSKPVMRAVTHQLKQVAVEQSPPAAAAPEAPAAPLPEPKLEARLRHAVRTFRERFIEPPLSPVADEPVADYTDLIEEEIERYSFGNSEDVDMPSLGKISRH